MKWALFTLLLLVACAPSASNGSTAKTTIRTVPPLMINQTMEKQMQFTKERVTLTATDGTSLVGDLYENGSKGIILLHQLNLDRTSWETFAKELQRQGYTVLALDLRGHGESQGDWHTFSETQFVAMLQDARAAATFLRNREKSIFAIMGASIGANTAFRYSSENKVPAILLSPGLNYRGIDINNITSTAPTLVIVGKRDSYAYSSSQELEKNNLFGRHELLAVESEAHGTFLLSEEGVTEKVIGFLNSIMQ